MALEEKEYTDSVMELEKYSRGYSHADIKDPCIMCGGAVVVINS